MTTNERLDTMYARDRARCRVRAITALGGLGAAVAGGFLTISLATSPSSTSTTNGSPASLSSTKGTAATTSGTTSVAAAPASSTSTSTTTTTGGS